MSGFIAEEFRTARKEHVCFLCGEKILKGEEYRRSVLFDGEMITLAEHKKCSDMIGDLDSASLMDSRKYGPVEFQEAANEVCKSEICPSCPMYDKECEECSEWKIPYLDCMPRIWEWAKTHHYSSKTGKWEEVKDGD